MAQYIGARPDGLVLTGDIADNAVTSVKIDSTSTGMALADLTVDTSTLVVDATNNRVGIGTTSPSQKIHVEGSIGNVHILAKRATQSQGQVALNLSGGTGGTDWIIYQNTSSDDLNIFGNSANRMTITPSGNVGIGTTPKTWNTTDGATQIGSRLSLNSFSNEGDIGFNYYYSSGWKYTNADDACQISMGNGNAFLLQYASAGSADAAITWTPYLTISTSGNSTFGGDVTISKAAATLTVTSTGAGQSNVIDLNSVNSDSSANDYRIGSGITGNNLFEIYDDNNSVPVYKYVESTPGHQWYVGGTALLNLNSTGLGIGTTSPNVKVQVGDGTSSQNISVDGGSGTAEGGVFAIRQGGTYKGALGTTAVIVGSGTSSDIRLQSYSDNIDIRTVAAKVITMATNDTTALTIDSNQDVIISGNIVTIGSTSHTLTDGLHVIGGDGRLRLSDSNAGTDQAVNSLIEIFRGANTNRTAYVGADGPSNDVYTFATDYAAGQIQLKTGSATTALTLDSSQNAIFAGRVGLGADSGSSLFPLNISQSSTTLPRATVTGDTSVVGWYMQRTGGTYPIDWYIGVRENTKNLSLFDNTNNTEVLLLESNTGNATFANDIQIANANEFKIPDSGGNVGSVNGVAIFAENPSANEDLRIEQRNSGNGRIILGIAGDDDLVIDTSGNIGIGTTSPVTPLEIRTTNKLGATFTGTTNGEGLTVTQTDYTADNYISLVEAAYDDSGVANPNVRIGALFTSSGSTLAFGTSNNFSSGITNIAMRIDPSGDIGIGTAPSYGRLHIYDDDSDIDMDANASGQLHIDGNGYGFGIALNGNGAQIYTNAVSRDIIFGVNETEIARVTPYGIAFNGDTAAANSLDDYEEGTWTPVLSATTTAPTVSSYLTQNGTYTKIGRVVIARCAIRATITAIGSGNTWVTGLPFAPANNDYSGVTLGLNTLIESTNSTYSTVQGYPQGSTYGNGTQVLFYASKYRIITNGYFQFTIIYHTSA